MIKCLWSEYKKWWILLIIIVVILILAFVFRVKKITFEGNTFFTEEQMEEQFRNNILENNVISFFVLDTLGLTPNPEYVREYEVSYTSINTIHIKLYEKSIVAGVKSKDRIEYFDKDGMVLDITKSQRKNIPIFEVEKIQESKKYEIIKIGDSTTLSQMLNIANLIEHYKIECNKVIINSQGATIYSGKITILLGKKDNYDESVSAMSSVLATAKQKGMSGEIDMSSYKVKGDVIFKQKK